MDPDNSPIGINVKDRTGYKRKCLEPLVDQPKLTVEKQNPTKCYGQGRKKEGNPEYELKTPFPGQIRARDEPGENHADDQCDGLPHNSKRYGVPQRFQNRRIAEGPFPARQPPHGSFSQPGELKTAHEQQKQRGQNQKGNDDEQQRDE